MRGLKGVGGAQCTAQLPWRMASGILCNSQPLAMSRAGMDCDTDLSFNFKAGHGNNRQPRTLHGYLVYTLGKNNPTNPWVNSDLNQGVFLDLSFAKTNELSLPVDPDALAYEGGASGRSLSITNRNRITSGEVFSCLLEAACKGLAVDVVPLFVCVGLLHPSHALTLCDAMIQKNTDTRVMCFPYSDVAGKHMRASLEDHVYQKWFKGELNVPGFARRPLVPYVPKAGEEVPQTLIFNVASLTSNGAFCVPEVKFKPFLSSDSLYHEAHEELSKLNFEAAQSSAPVWQVGDAGAPTEPPPLDHQEEPREQDLFQPLVSAFSNRDALLAAGCVAKAPTENTKFQVVVLPNGHGYAIATARHTTTIGEKICLPGSGRRLDEADVAKAQEQQFVVYKCTIAADTDHVFFKKDF